MRLIDADKLILYLNDYALQNAPFMSENADVYEAIENCIKGFILNRKQYDKIRKMDHCQMTMWAESVYKSGYKDGKETAEADSLTIDQVRECLLAVKGFGEKRVSAICDELQRKMSHTCD